MYMRMRLRDWPVAIEASYENEQAYCRNGAIENYD